MGRRRVWSDEEIAFIREHAADNQCSVLLEMVNREFGKNYDLAQLYRLKYRLKIRSPNVTTFKKGVRVSPSTEFKKGMTAWNKGVHYNPGGRCADTQFKKGNTPPNHRPVGSERLSYGKIQIKIAEPNVWENLCVLVWQSVNKRPFPKGCVIRFANGDITDYSPENLVILTRAQNAIINQRNIKTCDKESLEAAKLVADIIMASGRKKRGEKRKEKKDDT